MKAHVKDRAPCTDLDELRCIKLDAICGIDVCAMLIGGPDVMYERDGLKMVAHFQVTTHNSILLTVTDMKKMCLQVHELHELEDLCKRHVHALSLTYLLNTNPEEVLFRSGVRFIDVCGDVHITFFLVKDLHT